MKSDDSPCSGPTEACETADSGDQAVKKTTALSHPSKLEKVDKPCLETQLAEGEVTESSETLMPGVSGQKSAKRVRRSELGVLNNDIDGQSAVELRRSGRQRKPVVFLKMEPIQSKRSRLAQQRPTQTTDVGSALPVKSATKVEPSQLSKKKKTKKLKHLDNEKKNKNKKKKKKSNRKNGKHSSDVWLDQSSSSLNSDEEDDYFEQVLLERERNDSDGSDDDNGSVAKNAQNTAWLDQPESDFHLSDISDGSDTDSLTQGRNLARQKRLQRKLKAVSDEAVPEKDLTDAQQCQICLKSHLPEWILLCDQCDMGHHTMCLRPALMAIPEGDWYCPRCRHAALVVALEETAAAIDAEQKKQTLWRRMQERLNFVNISMTNILADDEVGTKKTSGSGRRARNSASAKRGEDESSVETGSHLSNSDCYGSDGDYSDESCPKKATTARQRKSPNRRGRGRIRSKKTRLCHPDMSSDEEVDDESSLSDHSPAPGPRSTRQRRAEYDLKRAFKGLDEAIEEDEKYREEKLQRQQRKSGTSVQRGDGEPAPTDGSPLPPGKSRGKDLSNILGPDWKDDDDGRPSSRPHRSIGRLSTSEKTTDDEDDDGDDLLIGGRKKRRRDSDSDFKPASGSATASSSAEQSEAASENEETGSASSDQSWLCSRRKRKMTRHGGTRSKRRKGRNSKTAGGGQRRRGRPVPSFEADDSYGPQRLRRCARVVVSYRETDEDEDNGDDFGAGRFERHTRRGRNAQLDSDEEVADKETAKELADTSSDCHRAPAGRNHRILSSDNESDSSASGDSNGGEVKECVAMHPAENRVPMPIEKDTEMEQEFIRLGNDVASSCGTDDDDYSPSALVISETSPCNVKAGLASEPVAMPRPASVDQDEESVEDEADDLIPRHRMFPSTATYAQATAPHDSPSPLPCVLNCPRKTSPDLFG